MAPPPTLALYSIHNNSISPAARRQVAHGSSEARVRLPVTSEALGHVEAVVRVSMTLALVNRLQPQEVGLRRACARGRSGAAAAPRYERISEAESSLSRAAAEAVRSVTAHGEPRGRRLSPVDSTY